MRAVFGIDVQPGKGGAEGTRFWVLRKA